MSMIQLSPSIPLQTPQGSALAILVIDRGDEHDLLWTCLLDSNGECWTFRNRDIRAQKNITQGREYISPYYDPDEVAFKKAVPKSLADRRKENQIKYETIGQTVQDFKAGQKVKIITYYEDGHFFDGETGKVVGSNYGYVKVQFDKPRDYVDGLELSGLSFRPEDLYMYED